MHLKVACVNYSNFFEIQELVPGVYKGIQGVEFEMLKILSKAANFTYELLQPDDRQWGVLKEDGTWSGMVGMVHRKEADLALNRLDMTLERSQVIDYSFPYYFDFNTFALKRAGMAPKTFYFINPFQFSVWILIAVSLLISSFILSGLQRLDFSRGWKSGSANLNRIFTATEVLIGNNKFGNSFHKCSTRIFFILNGLPIRVLMFSFSGLLLSFLMTPIMEPQIQTVEELAKASIFGQVKVVAPKGTALNSAFREAETGILRDLSENIRNNPESIPKGTEEKIARLQEGYALMSPKIALSKFVSQEGLSDKIFISNDYLELNLLGIVFKKGFCAIKDFNRIILRVHEAGIYEKILQDMFFQLNVKNKLQESTVQLVKPIVIQDLNGLFGLLIIGCVLAVITFICEICTHALKKKKKSKKKRVLRARRR